MTSSGSDRKSRTSGPRRRRKRRKKETDATRSTEGDVSRRTCRLRYFLGLPMPPSHHAVVEQMVKYAVPRLQHWSPLIRLKPQCRTVKGWHYSLKPAALAALRVSPHGELTGLLGPSRHVVVQRAQGVGSLVGCGFCCGAVGVCASSGTSGPARRIPAPHLREMVQWLLIPRHIWAKWPRGVPNVESIR